jgi:predicted dehydrogenase/threonine dehydrogenase-like Zn-dependent dehydrogenase
MLLDFGKAGWIEKARLQPDKVKMVLDKVKTDGILPTLEVVRNKIDQPLPMGYCNVGTIIAIGSWVDKGFSIGDRVASNGKHAEIVSVPKNLCVKIPKFVNDEEAAFTVIGAIALQGVRLVNPTIGETIVVTGLGLIGLLTVQILNANGCRVLGIDIDDEKLDVARGFGAETINLTRNHDPVAIAQVFSRGRGVDAVIITASTKSNEPVHQAALMCRKRGRIVLVGVTGLELSRADFYEKELSFQVSCSYGPGRYDPQYEERGNDYPFGLVRWTEQRNFEAILDMLAEKRLDVAPLISHRFPLSEAKDAYRVVESGKCLGILLSYPDAIEQADMEITGQSVRLTEQVNETATPGDPVVGFIGSGNYATGVLIPAFKKTGVRLKSVASSTGVSGVHAGKKFGFEETTTDTNTIIASPDINTAVITTRHDSHARYVCEAMKAGKHVFTEKPLCLTREELAEIETAYYSVATQRPAPDKKPTSPPMIMVGFNRRFSSLVVKMKELLGAIREPKSFIMTVNAGAIPTDHWTQDRSVGGGRIIGEGCHFIDLLRFLAGAEISAVQAIMIGKTTGTLIRNDKVTFTLFFADGSFGTVHYFANGHKSFPKERLEVFCAGRILQLDNFRKLTGFGWPTFRRTRLWRQDKGQAACAAAFVRAIEVGEPSPIPFSELVEVTRASFDIVEMLER